MRLWSVSTTVRNPERIRDFLGVLAKLAGEAWNGATQRRYQILLVQRKLYGYGNPQFENGLADEQRAWLDAPTLTETQAAAILDAKNYKGGLEMRGRQSFNPIKKMGLAALDANDRIVITDFGKYFLREDYDLGEVFFRSFLKWQYPNFDANQYPARDGYNVKPFVATLRLLKAVNALCEKHGEKAKGVSKIEFALFFTTLSDHRNLIATAEKVWMFRRDFADRENKKQEINDFAADYFSNHFAEYESWNNALDYADNLIRYFRLTRYFYLRGNGFYFDLEPRRTIEIDALLAVDNGAALLFANAQKWADYLGDMTKPVLPWETAPRLCEIRDGLLREIKAEGLALRQNAITPPLMPSLPKNEIVADLQKTIAILRDYRRQLFEARTHAETQEISRIENCIADLRNIFNSREKKPVELERLITLGLYALNDALTISPNYPVGDDNQPIFTAPANKPDIECFYQSFNAICEVTLLINRAQWFNEGQPVMRHLRDFEEQHRDKTAYCLFVAPSLHRDTLNTFWTSVKYEYEGEPQRIIPLTITQFVNLLEVLTAAKKAARPFSHQKLRDLFDEILVATKSAANSIKWAENIPHLLSTWGEKLAS
ncbi:MAG: AlwI family type II restriction endonuclease [Planctomycetota bacterium]|nr:AlwI family type II restriction endonuclease [Planctomycetota bacterium]